MPGPGMPPPVRCAGLACCSEVARSHAWHCSMARGPLPTNICVDAYSVRRRWPPRTDGTAWEAAWPCAAQAGASGHTLPWPQRTRFARPCTSRAAPAQSPPLSVPDANSPRCSAAPGMQLRGAVPPGRPRLATAVAAGQRRGARAHAKATLGVHFGSKIGNLLHATAVEVPAPPASCHRGRACQSTAKRNARGQLF